MADQNDAKNTYLGIQIDLTRDSVFNEQALDLLKKYYLKPNETSPQHAFARTATCYSFGDMALAQRIYDYASKLWLGFASPVLSNSVEIDWTGVTWDNRHVKQDEFKKAFKKGLPISCFLTYVGDDLHSLINHSSEERWLSVKGGGVGAHWSDVRSVSDIAPGPIPFLKTVDSDMTAYRQGRTRKGSYAAFIDVSHPDLIEFIDLRTPNGDVDRKCLNINIAVNITDEFIQAVLQDKPFSLRDPNDGTIRETHQARFIWQKLLETRDKRGEPYIIFLDEANRHLPVEQIEAGLKIRGSNICTEIMEATGPDRTAVCCLSSINLEHWASSHDSMIVEDLHTFLDNVLEMFIMACPPELQSAKNSAILERSIGIGAMGFHSMLQKHGIAWESVMAKGMNIRVFKAIKQRIDIHNEVLGAMRGSPAECIRRGVRNNLTTALAPTANNSSIVMTSPSIEPRSSNAVVHKTRAGTHLIRNPYLDLLFQRKMVELKKDVEWLEEQWKSVISNEGSVLHLEFLDENEKAIFKTAYELDQRWVVDHSRDRQEFIDQAQSVNLFFPQNSNKAYVNQVHLRAFLPEGSGTGRPLKSLYYYRTKPLKNGDRVGQHVERLALKDGVVEGTECLSCSG